MNGLDTGQVLSQNDQIGTEQLSRFLVLDLLLICISKKGGWYLLHVASF